MGRNWKFLAERRKRARNAEIERRNGPGPAPRPSLKLSEPRTQAELSGAIVTRAKEARECGEECRIILEAYGAHEPQAWEAKQLRRLIRDLRSQGDGHEAMAVERYADARVAWGQAINDLNAARDRPQPPQERPKSPGPASRPEPVRIDPVTSQAIPARLVETTPQDESPIRMTGRRANATAAPTAFRWRSGWVGGTNPSLPPQTSRAIPPWESGPAS